MNELELGKIVAGKYRLEEELGKGGAGQVFIVTHLGLGKRMALKVLHDTGFQAEEFRKRFEREARVAARLKHQHAVEVYDFGSDEGMPYLVMELLSGNTLLSLLKDGPLDIEVIYTLGRQIADVLDAAHQIGLVHRDLKPENILIEPQIDGTFRAVVVDFGLAFIAVDNDLNRMTQEGVISGTPQYLSPEQILAIEIGPESDVYSFGCILYEMATGQRVFTDRATVALLSSHMYAHPVPMRARTPERMLSLAFEELVLSMLAKTPAERPLPHEIRDMLDRLLNRTVAPLRGRPEELNDLRSRRAVTSADVRVTSSPAEEGESKGVIVVVGDIDPSWAMPLMLAGWACVPFSQDIEADVIILTIPEPGFVVGDRAVVAIADTSDFERCTALLKSGVADIASTPVEPSQLLKKIERAVRRKRRRVE